jgi:hypothetical protein
MECQPHHNTEELTTFISIHNIDIMLISELHLTEKSYLKLSDYTAYHTNHPARTAPGGTAIILKNCIKHNQLNSHSHDFLQATSASAEDSVRLLTISAKAHSKARTIQRFL